MNPREAGNAAINWFKRLIGLLVLFLIVDWTTLDRWQIQGSVVDTASGRGIAGTLVLIEILGDRPYVPYPHSRRHNDVCLGAELLTTDAQGRYQFDVLRVNQVFIHKRAHTTVLKPGWSRTTWGSFKLSSGLLSHRTMANIGMRQLREREVHPPPSPKFARKSQGVLDSQLAIVNSSRCGEASWLMALRALEIMKASIVTDDDRSSTVAHCRTVYDWGIEKSYVHKATDIEAICNHYGAAPPADSSDVAGQAVGTTPIH